MKSIRFPGPVLALCAVAPLLAAAVRAQPAPCYAVLPGGVRTFNGTSDRTTLAYEAAMDRPSLTGRISVAAWVAPNQTDTPQMVVKREGAFQLQLNVWDDPRFQFAVWTGEGIRSLVSDICLDTLRWQHVAGTYDGTEWRVYHNGRLVGSLPAAWGAPARREGELLWLGANPGSPPGMFFGGNAAGIAVYDTALTAQEVAALASVPPATLPPPAGSAVRTRTVNGVDLALEVGNGLRLRQIGGAVSPGGRIFVIDAGGAPLSSDRVVVRQAEITELRDGWQVPFDLPAGRGRGVLEFVPGGAAGLVRANLALTNQGGPVRWQVAFPHLEGLDLGGADPAETEFFFPFKEGWISRGAYDLSAGYGYVGWLPVVAAWKAGGAGIALQGRDTDFNYCSLRYRQAEADRTPETYHGSIDPFAAKFPLLKPGASLARYSLPFDLDAGAAWNAPGVVLHAYNGAGKFKETLSLYGQWARSTWWTHEPVPAVLRDRFLSAPRQGNHGGELWGGVAERERDLYHAHPIYEWAYWWDRDESIECSDGQPYLLTQGNYDFEPSWGGAPAYAADIARSRAAGVSTVLYLQGRIVWKLSRVGLSRRDDWGWMEEPGVVNQQWTGEDVLGCTGNYWSMCPQATGWHDYLRDACTAALEGSGADGVRLDSASEFLVCHNPNHGHTATLSGVSAMLRTVREGIKSVGADKYLLAEFAGSDAAARYLDGSLAQGHDVGFPLARQMQGYGILPFRFVYPEVKLFEWGYMTTQADYHRASRRMLFNGVGTTPGTGVPWQVAELYRFSEVLRGMGDVLGSTDCEPLYPTRQPGVVANRFSLGGRQVYTLWNQSGAEVSGPLLRVAGADGRRFVEMVRGGTVGSVRDGEGDLLSLTLANDEVAVIGVFPERKIRSTGGADAETFTVPEGGGVTLQAVDASTGEVLLSGGSSITVTQAVSSARHVVVRAVSGGYLVHDAVTLGEPRGAIVRWEFEEDGGATAVDAADPVLDGANPGTISGTRWARTGGRAGGGLRLDPVFGSSPSGSRLTAAMNSGLDLFDANRATIAAWINPDGAQGPDGSYIAGTGGNEGYSFLRINQHGGVLNAGYRAYVPSLGRQEWIEAYGGPMAALTNRWTYVAATFDQGVVTLWVDGAAAGSNSVHAGNAVLRPATEFFAGCAPWVTDDTGLARSAFSGLIDGVRVMNMVDPVPPVVPPLVPAYSQWLQAYPDLSNTAGPADPDGDGFDNNTEYAFGGNPTVGTPALLSMVSTNVSFVALNNATNSYTVQQTTNLATGPWTTLGVTPGASTNQTGIPLPEFYTRQQFPVPPGASRGFYRVLFSAPAP